MSSRAGAKPLFNGRYLAHVIRLGKKRAKQNAAIRARRKALPAQESRA